MTVSKVVSLVFDWIVMMSLFALVRSVTEEAWPAWIAGGIVFVFGMKQYMEGYCKALNVKNTWSVLKN